MEAMIAGGRSSASEAVQDGAGSAILAALCDDLNVSGALDIAEDTGGKAARSLIATLGLSE
jgi:hypothetical protein